MAAESEAAKTSRSRTISPAAPPNPELQRPNTLPRFARVVAAEFLYRWAGVMQGELTFESTSPETAAIAYTRLLGNVLREARPRQLVIDDHRVFVRGGLFRFVWNWNLLLQVTSATIDVIPGTDQVTVRYQIKVTELLVFCVFGSFFFLVRATIDGSWFAVIAGPAMVWLWLFGMNYLTMRSRMTSVFRNVARRVREAEVKVPVTVSNPEDS